MIAGDHSAFGGFFPYRAALSAGDAEGLERLLREGRERKEIVDRKEDEP